MRKSVVVCVFVTASLVTTVANGQAELGTAGAANAAAASQSLGGGGVPTMPGTAPGSTSPGGINVPQAGGSPPPTANPNQIPSTGTVNSTVPPRAPRFAAGGGNRMRTTSRTIGRSAFPKLQKNLDKALNESIDLKIKNICKGC